MEKSKSKDHRAAGKKRLEEFRQKKQQKGISTNASGNVLEKLADDGKLPSDVPPDFGRVVVRNDDNLHQKSDAYSSNDSGSLETEEKLHPGAESKEDGGHLEEDGSVDTLSSTKKDLVEFASGETPAFVHSENNHEVDAKPASLDQIYPEPITASDGFVDGLSDESALDTRLESLLPRMREQIHEDESGFSTNRDKRTPADVYGTNDQTVFVEFESLRKQLHNAEEAKKLVASQLLVKAEQQLEEKRKLESLVIEMESIRHELDLTKSENLQLAAELQSSEREFHNKNQRLVSDLVASQEEVGLAKREASLLSHDLEVVKKELSAANNKFATQLQSIQQQVVEREGKISQLVTELTANSKLFHGLQGEKESLTDELQRCRHEVEVLNEEMHNAAGEVEASKGALKIAENDLALVRVNLADENSKLATSSKVYHEVVEERDSLANELQRKRHEVEVLNKEMQNVSYELETSKGALEGAQKDLVLERSNLRELADENATLATSSKLCHGLQDEKVSLTSELQRCRYEVEVLNGEIHHISGELETSKRALEVAESDLALERRNLQELVNENSKSMEETFRSEREKLEGVIMAKDLELKVCRDQLDNVRAENLGLADEVGEIGRCLDRTKRQEGDLQAQHMTSQEQVKTVEGEKLKLSDEVESLKSFVESLLAEKGRILANYEGELEGLREELRKSGEEGIERSNELEVIREELRKRGEDNAEVARRMETVLIECRDGANRALDERTAVVRELDSLREQFLALTEAKKEEVTRLEADLQDLKHLFEMKVEENSSLSELLKNSADKLENSVQLARKLSNELEQEKSVSGVMLAEKEVRDAELVEFNSQWEMEKAEAQEHSRGLEAARVELQATLEALSNQLQSTSEERNTLLGDLHASKSQALELVKEKEEVLLDFENAKENWEAEKGQLESVGKAQAEAQVTELISLRRRYDELEQELSEARTLESTMRMDFQLQAQILAQTLDHELQLVDLVEHLEGEQAVAVIQIQEIGDQLAQITDKGSSLVNGKMPASDASVMAQAEARSSPEKLEGDKDPAAKLVQNQRGYLSVKLMGLKQSLTHAVKDAEREWNFNADLQKQIDAAESQILEKDSDLTFQRDLVTELHLRVQSFTQKLEFALGDALPWVRHQWHGLGPDEASPEYSHFLISKLQEEVMKIRAELQNASMELQKTSDVLRAAEDELLSLRTDKEAVVRSNEQMSLQIRVAAEEKTKLEASLKDAETLASDEKNNAIVLLTDLTEKGLHLTSKAGEISSLQNELSLLQSRIANQEAAGALEVENSAKLTEELQTIAALIDLLPGTVDAAEVGPHDVVQSEQRTPSLSSQLKEGITILLERCEDSAVQIESLKRSVALSSESGQDLKNLTAENLRLSQLLRSMQESIQGKDLEARDLGEQLEKMFDENASMRAEVAHAEQKLSSTREKLSLAVNKGKALQQQRDMWKTALEEKSKELDQVILGQQEDLRVKESALQSAERKIMELDAATQQVPKLLNVISAAEQVFMESDDVMVGLCNELGSPDNTDVWRSRELVDKIFWIIGAAKSVLLVITRKREREQILLEQVSHLDRTLGDSESKIAALAAELRSLEQEKEELYSRYDVERNEIHLEVGRLTEENRQLGTIVRQLDLDLAGVTNAKEELSRTLQEQAAKVSSLERDIAEQQAELLKAEASLDNNVRSLHAVLTRCCEALCPFELDTIRADSPLEVCRSVMKNLISDRDVTVAVLMEVAYETSSRSHIFEESVYDAFQNKCKVVLEKLSDDVISTVDEAFSDIERKGIDSQNLEHEKDRLAGELLGEQEEKHGLRLELDHTKQTLQSLQNRFGAALSDGESLAQQHDSLARELMEKSTELDAAQVAHKEELQSKELHLQETSQRLISSLEQISNLEKEVVSLLDSCAAERSLDDKQLEMEKRLAETELRASLAESTAADAENGKIAILSEIELLRSRLVDLEAEKGNLTKGNDELAQQLKTSSAFLGVKLQSIANEKIQLEVEIAGLQRDLELEKEKSEKRAREHNDMLQKHGDVVSQVAEARAIEGSLREENKKLLQDMSALELSLNEEKTVRSQLQSNAEAAKTAIRDCVEAPEVANTIAFMTAESGNAESVTELESFTALLVKMYKESVQEVREISSQRSSIAESQAEMTKAFGEMQQRLDSRDLELNTLSSKLKEADSIIGKQADGVDNFRKEILELRTQLEMANSQVADLSSGLQDTEQKGASLRDKLSLAIKKGKGLAIQKESLRQSLSEKELEVERVQEELEKCQSKLQSAVHEISLREEQADGLERKLGSLTNSVMSLEQKVQEKDNFQIQMGALLMKVNFPVEQRRGQFPEKLKWLVATVADAQKSVFVAHEEADNWKRTSIQLSSQLTEAQAKLEVEQQALSNLNVKLDEKEGELQNCQNQIVQLKAQLSEFGEGDKQLEFMSKRATYLESALQQKQAEVEKAEEALKAYAERCEESEKFSQADHERMVELERLVEELRCAEQQTTLLLDKIAKLEETVAEKEVAVKALEVSRGKAVNKLTMTVDKFQELCRQSEGLVVELERMHGSLTQKEAEIARLTGEVEESRGQILRLQAMVESKESFLLQLGKMLEVALATSGTREDDDHGMQQGGTIKPDEENCLAGVTLLQTRLTGLNGKLQARQSAGEAKDAQLQRLRRELEESLSEKARLKASLQNEQMQSERLRHEVGSMHTPVSSQVVAQGDEIEEIQGGNHIISINSPAPHVRGMRRPQSNDVAIAVDPETTQLLSEYVDKGHGFKSLTSSGFMPKGTRAISEQIDRLRGQVAHATSCCQSGTDNILARNSYLDGVLSIFYAHLLAEELIRIPKNIPYQLARGNVLSMGTSASQVNLSAARLGLKVALYWVKRQGLWWTDHEMHHCIQILVDSLFDVAMKLASLPSKDANGVLVRTFQLCTI